jgi:tetratricopeptide (TPR) repeat protein
MGFRIQDSGFRGAGLGVLPVLLVLSYVVPAAVAGLSESPAQLFSEGNANYQKGDFAAAEQSYRELVDAGARSSSVYYNLANACFKQKKLGEAIYYWEKTLQLVPRDQEAHDNLELANLLIVDRIETPPDPLPLRLLDASVHWLTIEQESWIVLALFTAVNVLLGLHFLARNSRVAVSASVAAGVLFLAFGSSLAWKLYEEKYRQRGVVVEQKVDIRSGPGPENIVVFTIHEGSKVRIRGEASGWYQVSLANGWTGWLNRSSVRVL